MGSEGTGTHCIVGKFCLFAKLKLQFTTHYHTDKCVYIQSFIVYCATSYTVAGLNIILSTGDMLGNGDLCTVEAA